MSKISLSQLAKLFQRLATSYSAGIDIRTIFEKEKQTGNSAFQLRAEKVHRQLSEGKELAEAMASTNGYFPDLAISVVQAGERGGRLEQAFSRLGDHYKNLLTFRTTFLQALAWPLFELVFAILIVGLLMGVCDNMMTTMGLEPINWLLMGSTVGNIVAYFVLVVLFFSGLAVLIVGTNQGWFGTLPLQLAMRIPLIGSTIECLALSRFAWTMSVAENAGMNALEIAQLSLRSTEIFYYKRLQDEVSQALRSGRKFADAFGATEAFPDELLLHIDVGETAGELSESMDKLSQDYQRRAETNLKLIGTIGFVLTIMFVGLIVGAICIFAVQQYVNLLQSI